MIYVIVLNWNNSKDTIECISSLKQINNPQFKILCVDNASEDNSFDSIKFAHPDIELIRTGKNLGYAGGNNFGIKYALEKGADYFWLLNNDTVVDENALKELSYVFSENSDAGAVGSRIMYYGDRNIIWFAGGSYKKFSGMTAHYLVDQDISSIKKPLEPAKLDFISGCSLMLSRAAIEKAGLLDESLFLYFEEMDYCERLKKRGLLFKMAPRSIVYHKISRAAVGFPVKFYYFTRNRLHISKKYFPVYLPFVILWCVRWPLISAIFKNRENLPYVKRAFADFFAGKTGPDNEK
jgi:GT2 family glycosyltransferase